ncbi:MAG TPA: riboflavin synthase [Gaiellaceae bacterium]|jgi:riboflavin synthase alpha subunit|nr:riboflavin synthase [Gaiellaceae bacterium]
MFTGIVLERGRIVAVEGHESGLRLDIDGPQTAARTKPSDSVSIDGCDLTALRVEDGRMSFEAVPETLRRTTLAHLVEGDEVNLEPALRVGDPLGGHYVQGHVDGVGRVTSVEPEGDGRRMWIEAPPELLRYCVEKGSVAAAGTALTVAELRDGAFCVALIPYTLDHTTLGSLEPGDEINLEVDVLAKYVERLVQSRT